MLRAFAYFCLMKFKTIEQNRPIRIAFLGCGLAAKIHSKTLSKFPRVERYYASRSHEKAAAFLAKYKGQGSFGSYEDAIATPHIDVVLVLTPPVSHLDLALAAIKAGKHVIVEKPPFLSSADFDLVRSEQGKTGVQVLVAENYFYKPSLIELRQVLASGLIGEVKFIFLNATKAQKTGNWRDEESLSGGGALFEGGIHWVNYLSNLGFPVQAASGFLPGKPQELDRSIQVVFKYENGPVATLLYSWEIGGLLKGLRLSRIYGTEGSITFESNGVFIFVRGRKWKLILPGISDIAGYRGMFTDFLQSLRTGREPAFNLASAKRDLELIEEVKRQVSAG
jgi:predicted dehydrogenase